MGERFLRSVHRSLNDDLQSADVRSHTKVILVFMVDVSEWFSMVVRVASGGSDRDTALTEQ